MVPDACHFQSRPRWQAAGCLKNLSVHYSCNGDFTRYRVGGRCIRYTKFAYRLAVTSAQKQGRFGPLKPAIFAAHALLLVGTRILRPQIIRRIATGMSAGLSAVSPAAIRQFDRVKFRAASGQRPGDFRELDRNLAGNGHAISSRKLTTDLPRSRTFQIHFTGTDFPCPRLFHVPTVNQPCPDLEPSGKCPRCGFGISSVMSRQRLRHFPRESLIASLTPGEASIVKVEVAGCNGETTLTTRSEPHNRRAIHAEPEAYLARMHG